MRILLVIACFLTLALAPAAAQQTQLAIHGLSHGHVGWVKQWTEWEDIELVGIVETDTALARRTLHYLGFPEDRWYPSLAALVAAQEVDAVAAFGSTLEHLETVAFCAPRGIHVMVEKPLATDWASAKKMWDLAVTHGIHLLTNYETSWMPGVRETVRVARADSLGTVRRMVFRTGHMGPALLGLSQEFLDWLLDPVRNGGGALMDFGCYGANLATWILDGEEPISVTCLTEHLQPDVYREVEDAATILLTYPSTQVIIQASWNWPHHVKDMDVYGSMGYALNFQRDSLVLRTPHPGGDWERELAGPGIPSPYASPFVLFGAVVRGEVVLPPVDAYALENNLLVMRILEAAKESARTGKTILLREVR
ncbi:MAG: Gfo/Idh/MocA family oxidoreductase [Bacteroidota bacterium]